MPWSVEYDSELGTVSCRYVGRVTDDDFRQATLKAFELAKANSTNRFLIDDSKWEGGASIVGLYDLPKLFTELGFERESRGALILPSSGTLQAEDARFFETVCINRGWQVKLFTDRQEALDWLTDSGLPEKPDAHDGS